jgi:hypothetical protein
MTDLSQSPRVTSFTFFQPMVAARTLLFQILFPKQPANQGGSQLNDAAH